MPEEDYADAFIADSALEWLDEQAPSDRPWYLNVSFVGPHPPFWHPGEPEIAPEAVKMPIIGAEDTPALRQGRSHYLQKCLLIDRYIGRVLEKLEAMGQAEDTLIVFTSDHGDMLGDRGIWDKRHFYEPSVGVPLILAGPGVPKQQRMEGARQSRDLVSLLDLYPTFLAAAGLDPSGDRSHAPSLRGRRFGLDLRAMLHDSQGHRLAYAELGTCAMLTDGAWKLVFDPEQGGVVQLFNRRNDPTEEHNLAGVAGYERISADLLSELLSVRVGLSQQTQVKERMRLQSFRVERRRR
jgi:choline-sulfatase